MKKIISLLVGCCLVFSGIPSDANASFFLTPPGSVAIDTLIPNLNNKVYGFREKAVIRALLFFFSEFKWVESVNLSFNKIADKASEYGYPADSNDIKQILLRVCNQRKNELREVDVKNDYLLWKVEYEYDTPHMQRCIGLYSLLAAPDPEFLVE
ncbi:MAG: hypothetical protein ABII23_09510, partial [bacterium]